MNKKITFSLINPSSKDQKFFDIFKEDFISVLATLFTIAAAIFLFWVENPNYRWIIRIIILLGVVNYFYKAYSLNRRLNVELSKLQNFFHVELKEAINNLYKNAQLIRETIKTKQVQIVLQNLIKILENEEIFKNFKQKEGNQLLPVIQGYKQGDKFLVVIKKSFTEEFIFYNRGLYEFVKEEEELLKRIALCSVHQNNSNDSCIVFSVDSVEDEEELNQCLIALKALGQFPQNNFFIRPVGYPHLAESSKVEIQNAKKLLKTIHEEEINASN